MLSDEELAEIERAWSAAMPAPWEHHTGATHSSRGVVLHENAGDEASYAAIEKAPEHIAKLLAEVKRLRGPT